MSSNKGTLEEEDDHPGELGLGRGPNEVEEAREESCVLEAGETV
jgi:hypothetical protein